MALQILSTKLHAPSIPPTHVSRPRLEELVDRGVQARLTLISAPAGFGKTSLLASWAQDRTGTAIAWLHLEASDNDWQRFLTYLIHAIQVRAKEVGDSALAALEALPPPAPEAVLTSLINDFETVDRPVVLILDDFHVIEDGEIHRALTFLLEHLPEQLRLIVSTRADPMIPLHKFRGRGHLVEIRADDLRFNHEEMVQFLGNDGKHRLSEQELKIIERRVEGWVTGLQMFALSMQAKRDVREFIEGFGGSHRFVLDYLMEEVFQQQSDPVQYFLLRTSVVDRLSGALCDHMLAEDLEWSASTDFPSSQTILEFLEASNLFLIPLDDQRHWFRYHQLFADVLRLRLNQQFPTEARGLQLRASSWFAEQGLLDEAVRYALAADDFEAASIIIEGCGYALLREGSLATLMRWFNQIPPDIIKRRPKLSVIFAWVLVLTAQTAEVEEFLISAEKVEDPSVELTEMHPVEIAAVRAYAAARQGDMASAYDYAQEAMAQIPDGEYIVRSVVEFVLAGVYSQQQDFEKTVRLLQSAIKHAQDSGNLHVAVSALNFLASIYMNQGKLTEAEATFQHALELGAKTQGRPMTIVAGVYANLARLYLYQNDMERSIEFARTGLELSKKWINPESQFNSLIVQAEIAHAQGNQSKVNEALQEARQLAEKYTLTPGTEQLMHRFEAVREKSPSEHPSFHYLIEPLSERELEVLRLMDKGYTNLEIGDELVIALGTVKAHSSSIYGKLQVSNRTQAVVRARELGLL